MMRRTTLAFSLLVVLAPGLSQAQSNVVPLPTPVPTRMQNVVGATVLQFAQKRGFSPTDPRTYQTLVGVSKALAQDAGLIAAGTAAGIAVAGTSPGWVSIAAQIALQLGVAYAINMAADGAIKWAFGPSSTPVTTYASNGAPSYSYQPSGGGTCTMTTVTDWCAAAAHPEGGYQSSPIELYPMTCLQSGQLNPTLPCKNGWATSVDEAYAQQGFNKVNSDTSGTASPNQTVEQAVNGLSDADKAKQLSSDSIAFIVNGALQQATADPSYLGIPYNPQYKVTPADVAKTPEYQANPPTVGDATTPHPNFGKDFSPAASVGAGAAGGISSSTTSTGPAPSTTVTPDSSSAPDSVKSAPDGATKVDLGPDPGIGAPTLEATPTAQAILDPILNAMPSLKGFTMPAHTAVCPKPSFALWKQTITISSHCDLMESTRSLMMAASLAAFGIASLLIILKA